MNTRRFNRYFLFCLTFLLLTSARPSYALFGVGDVVFDPSVFAQTIVNYLNMVKQYAMQANQYSTQLQQLANQYQQLSNDARNLQNLNHLLSTAGLDDLQDIMRNAQGIAADYSRLQRLFDQQYPEFSKYSTMSGRDYAAQADLWNQENLRSVKDAMAMQAKMTDFSNYNASEIRNLTAKTAAISGTRDGLQAVAQAALLQAQQLTQLQQLMAASSRAESSFLAQKVSGEAAARAKKQNLYRNWTKKGPRTVNAAVDKLH